MSSRCETNEYKLLQPYPRVWTVTKVGHDEPMIQIKMLSDVEGKSFYYRYTKYGTSTVRDRMFHGPFKTLTDVITRLESKLDGKIKTDDAHYQSR